MCKDTKSEQQTRGASTVSTSAGGTDERGDDSRSVSTTESARDNSAALGRQEDSERNLNRDIIEEEKEKLARRETKAVSWLRVLVFVLLVFTATFVSTTTYLYMRHNQERAFEDEFESHATKLIESFYETVERKLEAIDSLSVMYTSYARATGAKFPNVTLPDIEIRGAGTRILSDTSNIIYYPLVTDETRAGWEEYVRENFETYFDASYHSGVIHRARQDERFSSAYNHDRHLQQQNEETPVEISDSPISTIVDMLPNGTTTPSPEGSGPYLPVWQLTPVVPFKTVVNFNALSHPAGAGAYREMLKSGQAVMDIASNLDEENFGRTGEFFRLLLSHSQYRKEIQQYLGEPSTTFAYPVFDSFDPVSRKIAGMFSTTVFWVMYFKNILPENQGSILCVLENNHNQTLTFQVKGREAIYLGAQDFHDTKYDHLEATADVNKYIAERASLETRSYTSVDLNNNYTTYRLRTYPTQEFENVFVDTAPIVSATVVLLIFLFTSVVFVSYDYLVARRQHIVLTRALASGAIVSSLFPSKVRDKLYEEKTICTMKQRENSNSFGTHSSGDVSPAATSFFTGSHRGNDHFGDVTSNNQNMTPIADHFEETTILFADIVGFTAWSSGRDPKQVFELLETIYYAFDKIAARRKVFKVETIGDCYMAVAGVPEPQPDHAVILAKFAQDCLAKITRLVTEDLVDVLGVGTSDLGMRVGLHSGPVTAGVLRGQKCRFQLFGDTVNTASRMESTGEKGHIHCSQSTADALIKAGKQKWLTARREKVQAKGKGEMQTYWIYESQDRGSSSTVDDVDELGSSSFTCNHVSG